MSGRQLVSKFTVQGAVAVMFSATVCYLALVGTLSAEAFLAAAVGYPLGWAFGRAAAQS